MEKVYTILWQVCARYSVDQILSESEEGFRRYVKNMLAYFVSGHGV